MSLEEIVKKESSESGIYNNSTNLEPPFFWNCMKPSGGGEPAGALATD
jgi:Fe-Mn family superoxide dismutase